MPAKAPSPFALRVFGGLFLIASFEASAFQQGFDTVTSMGTVYRVVDADTFVVNLDDPSAYRQLVQESNGEPQRLRYLNDDYQSIRVRLANVDAPESVHHDESRNTESGRQLSKRITAAMEGHASRVSCFDWGDYGRAICSMTMPNGDDLGGWLIENGHSDYVTRWGRHPYLDAKYDALEGQ